MLFNSFSFAVFLPIVFIVYWVIPHRYRWVLLLVASYYFYMSWNAKYIVLIVFTTVISYVAGRLLENERNHRKKKLILVSVAVLSLGVLFFFKYFNFVSESIASVLNLFAIQMNPLTLKILLPVGISFYTFQTLSYVIDVYKEDVPAEHHFGYYATFVSFFPQLVAGPIERTKNLLSQIKAECEFDYSKASYGIKLMIWGFFKKLVIADVLSIYVSKVFDNISQYSGFAIVIASMFFSLQIYCDFSGYSDIAIGTAKLLGIDLMSNFKSPYFSQSIKEFWSRWHISLSTWFRDYVYIPLGGSRVGKIRHVINLMITFLVSGIWHGANWTFIFWGGVHGIYQVVENVLFPQSKKNSRGIIWIVRVGIIFIICTFAWIFFVSNSVEDACYALGHMFSGISSPIAYLHDGFAGIGLGKYEFFKIILFLLILFVYDYFSLHRDCISWINKRNVFVRHFIISLMLLIILCCSYTGQSTFVYFQF